MGVLNDLRQLGAELLPVGRTRRAGRDQRTCSIEGPRSEGIGMSDMTMISERGKWAAEDRRSQAEHKDEIAKIKSGEEGLDWLDGSTMIGFIVTDDSLWIGRRIGLGGSSGASATRLGSMTDPIGS